MSNGIASSNMTPNTPTLDSRPLFNAGVAYAQKNNIPTVTADRGSYYFLTPNSTFQYIYMYNVNNLTVDLQYSDLYFSNGDMVGLDVQYVCRVNASELHRGLHKPAVHAGAGDGSRFRRENHRL